MIFNFRLNTTTSRHLTMTACRFDIQVVYFIATFLTMLLPLAAVARTI